MRTIYNMNFNWKFHDGDIENTSYKSVHSQEFASPRFMKSANCGIAKAGYDINIENWDDICVPHDLRHYRAVYDHTTIPSSQGYLTTGVAWYRKEFFLDTKDADQSVTISFDGVYRDSEIYVNGSFVGRHLSGYTSFNYDITDFVEFGQNNAVAVRVDATKFEGWWYEAGGIYRDVKMTITDKLKVKENGVYVVSKTNGDDADINVAVELQNECAKNGEATLNFKVIDADKNIIATATKTVEVCEYEDSDVNVDIALSNITRWDIDAPYKYAVEVDVIFDGKVIDNVHQIFGIRDIEYTGDRGIILNGRQIKVKGVCVHDDFAGVGGAMSREVIRHKIFLLKQMGCNGYRCSHNPPSPYLLEACDDYGLLVMDEVRLMSSSKEYLQQLTDLIKRDRNNPCVFLWSIGNEEMAIHGTMQGVRTGNHMQRLAHKLDSTRPCTYANNCDWNAITDFHMANGFDIDVLGLNYHTLRKFDMYKTLHAKYPHKCMIGTENASLLTTRGQYLPREEEKDMSYFSETAEPIMVYANPARKYNVSEYGESYPTWGANPMETMSAADDDFVAGYFLWTGFDYRGELIPFKWPSVVSRFGTLDLCGFMKDCAHQYKVKWSTEPSIHMYPHWTFDKSVGALELDVVSNTDEVELFINGVSQGRKVSPKRDIVKYYVEYIPGEAVAVAYNNGVEVARVSNKTAGAPAKVNLEIVNPRDYVASGEDNVFIKLNVLDKDGNHCPTANNLIKFEVSGAGEFLGAGNGDPLCLDDDMVAQRSLFNGLALAILKTSTTAGTIKFTATSKGLESASLEINVSEAVNKLPTLEYQDTDFVEAERIKDDSDGAF